MTTAADDSIRVLVVDDTPDIRLLLRMALGTEDDMEVVGEAGNGRQAVEEATRTQPDVVLLDLAMPVMDGLEALPLLKAASPDSHVVILSGFEATAMAASASAAGAAAYLQKGVSPDVIIGCVRRLARPGAALPPTPRPVPSVSAVPPAATAEEVAQIRSAIAATAHELRNPVSALLGVAQTLARHGDRLAPDKQAGLLSAMERQARVLDRLTGDLLAASHAELGLLECDGVRVELHPALRSSALLAGQLVEVVCAEDVVVRADPVRVDQMLVNLLMNAQKYGAAPVSLHASPQGAQVSVEVSDRGAGVPAEFVPRLFEQYARAPGTRRSGSGIGLYLVRALAEAQGGRAWHRPHPKGGAVFGFSLPAWEG